MKNILKRKPKPYEAERQRLLLTASTMDPTTKEYMALINRLDQLDQFINRTSEFKKTAIPAFATIAGMATIYSVQQFAGILLPRLVETLASRSPQRSKESE